MNKNFERFILVLLFIFCFNIGGFDQAIPLLFVPYLFVNKVKIDKNFILTSYILFGAVISYAIPQIYQGTDIKLFGKVFFPLIFLYLGYIFGKNKNKNDLVKIMIVPAVSFFIFCFLIYEYNTFKYGSYTNFTNENGRVIHSFLNDQIYAVTSINGYLCIMMSFISLIFFKIEKLKYINVLYIFSLLSIYEGMSLANRSTVPIVLIPMIITIIFNFRKVMLIKLGLFIFTSLSILIFYSEKILLLERLKSDDGLENSRAYAWKQGWDIFINNPIGGSTIKPDYGFAHNLWLDIGLDAGWIATILFFIFSVLSLIVLIKFIIKKEKNIFELLFILNIIAINIIFLIEPVYQGLFKLFCIYCLYIGIGLSYMSGKINKSLVSNY